MNGKRFIYGKRFMGMIAPSYLENLDDNIHERTVRTLLFA
jgi:hypothetical protein